MKYQQGDVLIRKIEAIPANATKLDHKILAEGEATGHAHRASGAVLYEHEGVLYLRANSADTITHEEHATVKLPAGDYRIGIVREYDPFTEEARNVQD